MRCRSPRTVGFKADGKTISWSRKDYSKEFASFQLPCGKCIECRLDYARQWAVRCVHEAQMYKKNSFITLTYSDENLGDNRLDYSDFQKFAKRLRFAYPNKKISYFVTGEYGEKSKRKHWHAIIFNFFPSDAVYKRTSSTGNRCFESSNLERLWGYGLCEVGSVTIESAGYCARYAAKMLVHGSDQDHEFHPISKKSSKHAIGKKWLEKYWPDVFTHGYVVHEGMELAIPRYYERWFKQEHPEKWRDYVTNAKLKKIERAVARAEKEAYVYKMTNRLRPWRDMITPQKRRALIQDARFKQLQQYQKDF